MISLARNSLPLLLAGVLLLAAGCSDPDSRLAAAFERGLSRYKAATADGFDPHQPTASSGIARLGQAYAHSYAVPANLEPLMTGSEEGMAMLRRMQASHPDPQARTLASECLRVLQSRRKVRFRVSGPFPSGWMAYHYD